MLLPSGIYLILLEIKPAHNDPVGNKPKFTDRANQAKTFAYDTTGRRTILTLTNGILVEYVYDAASRVTGITYKQNGSTVLGNLTYEYDKAGNRTKIGGSFARTGIPQAISSTAYNAANHQTTFGNSALTYDNNGNVQTITDPSGTTTYTWNARNQLVGISGPSVSASFVYDGLGRRQKKTINGTLTEFLYDGVNPVQETSGANVLANILPGLGIDEFLTRTDVVAGATSHFLTDALGSAIALADSSGVVQTEYTYEPFGKTTGTGITSTNPFQYTHWEYDGTGLYYYRARFYHPELQRFISEDPILHPTYSTCPSASVPTVQGSIVTLIASRDPQILNLYNYVGGNPLGYRDPLGLDKHPPSHCQMSFGECFSACFNIFFPVPVGVACGIAAAACPIAPNPITCAIAAECTAGDAGGITTCAFGCAASG